VPTELVETVRSTLTSREHPYLQGAWTPHYNEYNATDLEVIGEIPRDLDGVYVRTGENQVHEPIGRYHPFDGDGLIHIMSFRDGNAEYRNRFVRTKGFLAEQEAGRSLWAGLMERPDKSTRPGWGAQGSLKDSSSTDVCVHAGMILSTFYQCGEAYRLDPLTLDQLGVDAWTPAPGISAHPKVCPDTGELLFFNYSKVAPFMHYGVVGPDNRLKHYTPIPLPGPRLPHDMAFTPRFSILNDMPLYWNEELLKRNVHAVEFHADRKTRFAIIPRYGRADEVRWFEAEPTYVLHWLNAHEDGETVVLDGYFQEEPQPTSLPQAPPGLERMMAYLDQERFRPKFHRWRFDLKTGRTHEERLLERNLEFGMMNQRRAGKPYRYAYHALPEPGWFLFRGLLKHDLETGETEPFDFGPQRFGSEAPFAPRLGATSEDDGYLLSFITDLAAGRSECLVLDAKRLADGPVCRIFLPEMICAGTHSTWASRAELDAARRPASQP
jgi:carotenoid cleavage dioxygenase-like enzyme